MEELGRELTAAILIDVPDEEVIRRLGGRRTCVKEGHIFHVEFDPPKNEGVCDVCGARLDRPRRRQARRDPQPARDYHDKTAPLVAHYESAGILRRVDGTSPPDEVSDRIRALLATLRMEEEL